MNEHAQIVTTKFFLTVGAIFGLGSMTLSDIDLIFGIVLKFVSIVSFVIVIIINIPNFINTIKKPFKKQENDGHIRGSK